jgi:hypothetical protein
VFDQEPLLPIGRTDNVDYFHLFCGLRERASLKLTNPNDVVEWLTLLFHIREVQGTNPGQDTGYSEVFVVFLSPPGEQDDVTS